MSTNRLRLATLVSVVVACLAASLVSTTWAMPGQDVSPQTIPTRTPDRRTRQPATPPLPTGAAVTATPNAARVTLEPAAGAPATMPAQETTGEDTAATVLPPPDLPPPTTVSAETPPPTLPPADTRSPLPPVSASPLAFPTVVDGPVDASEEPPPASSPGRPPFPDIRFERNGPGVWGLMGGAALVLLGLHLLVSRPRGR